MGACPPAGGLWHGAVFVNNAHRGVIFVIFCKKLILKSNFTKFDTSTQIGHNFRCKAPFELELHQSKEQTGRPLPQPVEAWPGGWCARRVSRAGSGRRGAEAAKNH